jgi:hypothetical protein
MPRAAYIVATLWADTLDESIRQEKLVVLAVRLIFRFQPKQPIVV